MSSIADAVMEALGLQIQALLAERKAVALALGCGVDETVLDAATRVVGDLANTEKQIDDVRDILKAKVGELTVDAATHAIVLAQNHATLVKQVEQLTRDLDEARRRLTIEREHSTASDRHLVDTHEALGGRTGVEHVTEAAKRVVAERDAYRIRVKDMESNVCKLSAERDEAKALATTLAKERDEARADTGRMIKDLDDVRSVLEARFNETTADAARRVVDAAHNVVDAAREVERTAKVLSQTQDAISDLEQKASERETAAILAALGARAGEKAVDVAKRVAKERDELRDALQTVSHCQQVTARSFLSLAETLGVSPSDAASRVNSIIAREEEFRLAVAAYAQQDEELREILLAGPTERTLEAARRVAKAYEEKRKESFLLQNDLENIRKTTKAFNGETAHAAVWRICHVALQNNKAREELEKVRIFLSLDSWESAADATARIIKERIEAIRDRDRAIFEREKLRDELDSRMGL